MTLFGSHTADELKDLVKAKDYDINQVQQAYDKFASTWASQDASGHSDWLNDWKAFRDRYGSARLKATLALTAADLIPGPDYLKAVESPWLAILHALSVQEGVRTKGDFQELYVRFADAQKKPVDFSKQPTPISHDTDLWAYQKADTIIKAEKAAEKAASGAVVDFLKDHWIPIAVIGAGLGLGVYLKK